jgi:hypothetical protein
MDEATIAAAALLEAAQNNQKVAEASFQKLEALIKLLQELPRNVTPELKASIEKAHREELAATRHEFQALTTSLRHARERMTRTWLIVGCGVVLTAVLAVTAVLLFVLPSSQELQALRAEKEQLAAAVADLEARGGHAHFKTCGNPGEKLRLCALVDPTAGGFGTPAERYMVLKGY